MRKKNLFRRKARQSMKLAGWNEWGTEDTPRPSITDFEEHLSFFDEHLWGKQRDIADAVFNVYDGAIPTPLPAVCCPSGHGIGKSWLMGRLMAFIALKHSMLGGCDVIMLTPNRLVTATQIYSITSECVMRLAEYFDEIEISITKNIIKVGKSQIIALALNRRAHGENDLQGYHAPDGVFVCVDESANFKSAVAQSLHSCISGQKGAMLLNGNPISGADRVYDNALSYAYKRVNPKCLIPVCSGDHPNVQQEKEVIKGAVSWEYVASIVDEHVVEYNPDLHDDTKLHKEGATIIQDGFTGVMVKLTFNTRKYKRGQVVLANAEACRRVFGLIMKITSAFGVLPADFFDMDLPYSKFWEHIKKSGTKTVYLGVDSARAGHDKGKIVATALENGEFHTAVIASFDNSPSTDYCEAICAFYKKASDMGVENIIVSIDGSGGYGAGVYDTMSGIRSGRYELKSSVDEHLEWFSNLPADQRKRVYLIEQQFAEAPKNPADKLKFKTVTSQAAIHMKHQASACRVFTYNWSENDKTPALARSTFVRGDKIALLPKKDHKAQHGGVSPDAFDALLLSIISYGAWQGVGHQDVFSDAPKPNKTKKSSPKRKPQNKPNQNSQYSSTFKRNRRRV